MKDRTRMDPTAGTAVRSKVPSPELSVVIPFYGDNRDLAGCLEGLRNQTADFQFEIIVAQSGEDPEVARLVDSLPNAVLISSPSLMYPGKARNTGVSRSRADRLAFIDADCVPDRCWVSEVYSGLKDGIELVMGPVTDLYPFHPIASIDNLLQFVDFQKYRPSKGITHYPSCNMGITKALFFKAGGFPEDMEAGEDVRFGEAVTIHCGGAMLFKRTILVRHRGRTTFGSFLKHNESYGFFRGYYQLRMSVPGNGLRGGYLTALFFGFRRLAYILLRTSQWNPAGLVRIAVYSPVLLIGLLSWSGGFRRGIQKRSKETNES